MCARKRFFPFNSGTDLHKAMLQRHTLRIQCDNVQTKKLNQQHFEDTQIRGELNNLLTDKIICVRVVRTFHL